MKVNAGICLLLLSCNVFGQTDSSRNSFVSTVSRDGSKIVADASEIFSAPFHFDNDDWLKTVAVVGGTVLLFTVDEPARSFALRNDFQLGNNIADIGKQYGREVYGLSLAGGLYAGGLAFKNDDIRVTGLMLFESVAMAGIINMAFKSILGRRRPYTDDGAFSFRGMQFSLDNTSLPSGHSTVAFSVSSVLANRLKNTYATIGLYSLATVTALSRVYHDYHWVSDTFLGAAIGTAVGCYVSQEQNDEDHARLEIVPSGSGVRIEYRF